MINITLAKNFLVKLEPFINIALVACVFCLIFILGHSAIFDLDIWLHLKTGEFILQNKNIPSTDIFSFTMQGKSWYDHSWLFQLLSYLIYSRWQADGLVFVGSLAILLSFLVLFLMGRSLAKSYLVVSIWTIVATYASITRFNIRPDIFSLFFFALYLYLLRLHIEKKVIWYLVPIQILWVNFHGYFFLGPLLVIFFIFAEFLRRKLKFLPWQWKEQFALSDKAYRRLKKLFLFIILAGLLNPAGLRGALYPFFVFKEFLFGRVHIFLKYIQELKPTFGSGKALGIFYYTIIISCFSLIILNIRRLKIIDILLFLFFFLFSLSLRNIVFFIFICNMIVLSYTGPILKKVSTNIQLKSAPRQALYVLFRCQLAIALIVWLGFKIDNALDRNYYDFDNREFKSCLIGIDQRNYPKKAVDFALENNIPSNMFNDFNSGAYLIGRAYPERKVFIDGRTELYGPDFFKQYMDLLKGDTSTFERIIDEYQINAIFLSVALNSMPDIADYLYKSPYWKLVFLNESAVIFLKDVPVNQELIKRYKIDLNKYIVPKVDVKDLRLRTIYPWPYIKRAFSFDLFKKDELVILECTEALRIMPHCAEAYHLRGKVYLRKGLYQDALENLRSSLLLLPNNVEALVDLGVCFQELKETKLSINTLKRAIMINKKYAPAYYRLGCVYLATNNETEAIYALNKAIRYELEEPSYHFKLAEAIDEKGKKLKDNSCIAQARQELQNALKLANRYQDNELKKKIEDKLKEIADR